MTDEQNREETPALSSPEKATDEVFEDIGLSPGTLAGFLFAVGLCLFFLASCIPGCRQARVEALNAKANSLTAELDAPLPPPPGSGDAEIQKHEKAKQEYDKQSETRRYEARKIRIEAQKKEKPWIFGPRFIWLIRFAGTLFVLLSLVIMVLLGPNVLRAGAIIAAALLIAGKAFF